MKMSVFILANVMLLYAMSLLQFGETQQDVRQTVGTCFNRLSSTKKDLIKFNKVKKGEDGSLRLTGTRLPCHSLRKLGSFDCRCLALELLRNQDDFTEEKEESLEFLELLDTNKTIANVCKVGNNLDCSAAGEKIVRNFFPEKNTKLDGALRSRFRTCASKAKEVVSGCTEFMTKTQNGSETIQAGDESLNKCCGTLGATGLDKDCLCLILENEKASPDAKISRNGRMVINMLNFITTNEQTSTCGNIRDLNCAGIAKALQDAVRSSSILKDLQNTANCERAAADVRDVCASTVSESSESINNPDAIESIVCCNALEKLGDGKCGCKLGNEVHAMKDTVNFLEVVRTSDKIVNACPNFSLKGVRDDCSAGRAKNPKLFGDCEDIAEKTMKICAPMVKAAAENDLGGLPCCNSLDSFYFQGCMCSVLRSRAVEDENALLSKTREFINLVTTNRTILQSCGAPKSHPGGEIRCNFESPSQRGKSNQQILESCLATANNITMPVCASTVQKAHQGTLLTKPLINPGFGCCPEGTGIKCGCDPQSESCCQQLRNLADDFLNGCMCKILKKRVPSRQTTVDFLNFVKGNENMLRSCRTSQLNLINSLDCTPLPPSPGLSAGEILAAPKLRTGFRT